MPALYTPPRHQPFLVAPAAALDLVLALHGGRAIGLGFPPDQRHRTALAGVARAAAGVVLGHTALHVGGPAGVVAAISAADDVDEGRLARRFFGG